MLCVKGKWTWSTFPKNLVKDVNEASLGGSFTPALLCWLALCPRL